MNLKEMELECGPQEMRMGGNPRENVTDQGFWDGGAEGHGTNDESAGRTSGSPGGRETGRTGYRTDLEFPIDDNDPPAGE